MSQLTIYLSEQVLRRLRADARRARKSVSAYVAEMLEEQEPRTQWPKDFRELYGSCRADLPHVDDSPPEQGPVL